MQSHATAKTGTAGAEGIDYQLNLILVSLLRASRVFKNHFSITTELKSVGKFDDLVLTYSDITGVEHIRCLQAKHKKNEKSTISINDLLYDTKKGFNLTQYFKSYEEHITQLNVEDIILFTNVNIHDDAIGYVTAVESADRIFHFSGAKEDGTSPKLFKFNDNIKEEFKFGKLKKLAQLIVFCGHRQLELKHSNNTCEKFHCVLGQEVFDVSKKCFLPSFLNEEPDMLQTTKQFRDILLQEFSASCPDHPNFDCLQDEEHFSLKFSPGFGTTTSSDWPQDTIISKEKDEAINNFFDLLLLAVNQPNDSELEVYIHNEIKDQHQLLEAEMMVPHLIKSIRDWFKQSTVSYLSSEDLDKFQTFVTRRIEEFRCFSFSEQYIEKLNASYLRFSILPYYEVFQQFLENPNMRIFHLLSPLGQVNISSLKMLRALQSSSEQKYLFVDLGKQSLEQDLHLLHLFKISEEYNILVVIFTKDDQLRSAENDLCGIINTDGLKKIIVITEHPNVSWGCRQPGSALYQQHKDVSYFEHLATESQEIILKKSMKFQGYELKLSEVNYQSFPENGWWIELVENEDIDVASDLQLSSGYEVNYYIPRTITRRTPVINERGAQNILRQNIVAFSESTFASQVKFNPNGCIHFMKQHPKLKNGWTWEKTHGKIDILRLNIQEFDEQLFHEENFFEEKLHILSDIAGMGKSTVLSHLAHKFKNLSPSTWVVQIRLRDISKELQHFAENGRSQNYSEIKEFISAKILKLSTPLERNLFDVYMANETCIDKMIFLFDGYDEIHHTGQTLMLDIMGYLVSSTSVKLLIVSTRPHMQYPLEGHFSKFALKLIPFSYDDKLTFLSTFWINSYVSRRLDKIPTFQCPENIQNLFVTFAIKVISGMSDKINDYASEFTGIPLQMRMIAEILESKAINFGEQGHPITMNMTLKNLLGMYTHFIEKKRTIYIEEKCDYRGTNETVLLLFEDHLEKLFQLHLQLAVNVVILSKQNITLDESDLKYLPCLRMFGLITEQDGMCCFLHRTFAEYFIAMGLVRPKYEKILIEEKVIQQVFEPKHKVVRRFIADLLKTDERSFYSFLSHLQQNIEPDSFLDIFKIITEDNDHFILQVLISCVHSSTSIPQDKKIHIFLESLNYCQDLVKAQAHQILLKNIKDTCMNYEDMILQLLSNTPNAIYKISKRNQPVKEKKDIIHQLIDYMQFVEDQQLVRNPVLDRTLLGTEFLFLPSHESFECYQIYLDYLYSKKTQILNTLLDEKEHWIAPTGKSMVFFSWLKDKINLSLDVILNLVTCRMLERYTLINDYSDIENYLDTCVAHIKLKFRIERIGWKNIEPMALDSLAAAFRRLFELSTSAAMDRILCEHIASNFEPGLFEFFLYKPRELTVLEFYTLWSRNVVLQVLSNKDGGQLQMEAGTVFEKIREKLNENEFKALLRKRNDSKETILQRACAEDNIWLVDKICFCVDSVETFKALTAIEGNISALYGIKFLLMVRGKFPAQIQSFLIDNSDLYFFKYSFNDVTHFDILIGIMEADFTMERLIELLNVKDFAFNSFLNKLLIRKYTNGVRNLINVIKGSGVDDVSIFQLMNQKHPSKNKLLLSIVFNARVPEIKDIIFDFVKDCLTDDQIETLRK